jgi:hypothetical protein
MIRAIVACFALLCAACATQTPQLPDNVTTEVGRPEPTPRVAANDAPPQILHMYFSSLDLGRLGHAGPSEWRGSFTTTTNVASVEVRTNLFSINVPRTAYGRFAFIADVIDLPPIFVRSYTLRVLARNSAGQVQEWHLPLRIH